MKLIHLNSNLQISLIVKLTLKINCKYCNTDSQLKTLYCFFLLLIYLFIYLFIYLHCNHTAVVSASNGSFLIKGKLSVKFLSLLSRFLT